MSDTPDRGVASGGLWQAGCKDCQAERLAAQARHQGTRARNKGGSAGASATKFEYSNAWADRMLERGNTRSDRCERHRKSHRQAIQALAVPYISLQVIGEVLDPKRPTGPLGGLGPLPVVHHRTAIDVDLDRHEFGMSDRDIVEILNGLRTKQVAVIEAGTGTGKSTFMPFRLMNPPLGGGPPLSKFGPIVVTEPRLAAAKGVARFVGEELCLGHDSRKCTNHIGPGFSVGYQVKGEKYWDSACELIYVTDGTMINWLRDGQLARIGTVIVDEAHERSENIDIILAQLRDRLQQYKHLRVVVTSATLDRNFFVEYFGGPDKVFHLSVPAKKSFGYGVPLFPDVTISDEVVERGFTIPDPNGTRCEFSGWAKLGPEQEGYPAEELHKTTRHLATLRCIDPIAPDEWKDKMPGAIAKQVVAIAAGTEWGDILAFLPTSESIKMAVTDISERLSQGGWRSSFDVYPLLSSTEKEIIDKATGPRLRGDKRKIVVSSNLAETSLTVKGVRYVVDSALICQPEWDPQIASGSYPTKPHSQSGVRQRWGRVGRDAPGWVFPLYSTAQFLALPRNTPPGSAQANLEGFYLKLMAAGLDAERAVLPVSFRHDSITYDADALKVIGTFESECRRAQNALRLAGAVDPDGHLTDYGRDVERFPGTGSEALALMLSEQLACVHEVALSLHVLGGSRLFGRKDSILAIDSSWPIAWRVGAVQRHRALAFGCKDDLEFLLRVYQQWQNAAEPSAWCATWWINEAALQAGWSDAMESVGSLSAAMKGEAHRVVAPELAERVRAVLTKAMVGIRYEQIDGGMFRAMDTTSPEPQVAQLGRSELVDPGDRVLAFGRFRAPGKEDAPSRVFISHAVRMCDWALTTESKSLGLDLIVRSAERSRSGQELALDPLTVLREELPIGSLVHLVLGRPMNGVQEVLSARTIAKSPLRPPNTGAARAGDDNSGFDREWDPLGKASADMPDEELSEQILNPRSLENNDTIGPKATLPTSEARLDSAGEESSLLKVLAKAAWPHLQLQAATHGRVAAYDVTDSGRAVLIIEPVAAGILDAFQNSDLQFGQEIVVSVCGAVRDNEREYVQFVRSDLRGYLFVNASEGGLPYYDLAFTSRLTPGESFDAVIVPDEQGAVAITLLPALHRHLAKSAVEALSIDDESVAFHAAAVLEGPNRWGRVLVELEHQDRKRGVSYRFEVHQRDFRGPLANQTAPGRPLLVALEPDLSRNRPELALQGAERADALAERHPNVFKVNRERAVICTASAPLDLMHQLALLKGTEDWPLDVWRFYAGSLRMAVKAVRPKTLRKQVACPSAIASLVQERKRDLQQRYSATFRVDGTAVEVAGYDAAANDAAAAHLAKLGALPRVVARLPANTGGRVVGKSHENRKRLEALPGVSWVWVDGDVVGIIAESSRAIDAVISDIRGAVESATGELRVPPGKNGYLIGTKGVTIDRLRTSTGCRATNPDKGQLWIIEGPRASAVQEFIRQATSIAGGSGVVTASKDLKIVEDTRQVAVSWSPKRPEAATAKFPQSAEKPSSGCFIATACYGDSKHPDVAALRHWRDASLASSTLGRVSIRLYYHIAPRVACFLVRRRNIAAIVRMALSPVVRFARFQSGRDRNLHR